MTHTLPTSARARRAIHLVTDLQAQLVARLTAVLAAVDPGAAFAPVQWARDGGRHGGGERWVGESAALNRASVNVSCVHYDDTPDKALGSATALSTIVHPANPHAPSMHMHISWTELRDGRGYWRVMADLNPSIPIDADREAFAGALREAAGPLYEAAAAQGDRYFFIPALGRHRGVTHFYLEDHASPDPAADEALARRVGEAVIAAYGDRVAARQATPASAADRAAQLAYHTLYLFQVLTLDRGTTSGLLIHDQNDVGIMGSLPARVDPALLTSWRGAMPEVQRPLLDALVHALEGPVVAEAAKARLAAAVRAFYREHPEALAHQARGDVIPPTVANHR